jgi:light-regulated signal transduction histidine kinase (bacteriophytochrome)
MPQFLASITDFIPADGIGAYYGGEMSLIGNAPTREEFLQILTFLNKTAPGRIYSTQALTEVLPAAADFVVRAAGLLSIPVSRVPRDYLVFRNELQAASPSGAQQRPPASAPMRFAGYEL